MLTLMLLRHAKSDWDNPALADYDRPLAKRGRKAAPRMGAEIAALGLRPDLILCSSAVRAKETLALVLPALGSPAPEVVYDDAIYMATPAALLTLIRMLPKLGAPSKVMVVGHNPGLEELAQELVGGGGGAAQADLAAKFPTCALAAISFEADAWSDVAPGTGRVQHFLTPARLS